MQAPQPQPDERSEGRTPVLTLVTPERGVTAETTPQNQQPENAQETTTEIPAVPPANEPPAADQAADTPAAEPTDTSGKGLRHDLRAWIHDLIHQRPASIAETVAYSRTGDWAPNPTEGQRAAHLAVTRLCNVVQVIGCLLTRVNTPTRFYLLCGSLLITIAALITFAI